MQLISENFGLLWEALFLRPEPYAAVRDQKNPATKGLLILLLLGLALALAAFIGTLLAWSSSPDLATIKETVFSNLQEMNWWVFVDQNPQVRATWLQMWDGLWAVMGFLNPSPASGLAGFIVTPLSLILSWFIFGVAAHLTARLFGGQGQFGQMLGTTSLAEAPQLLGLFAVVPFVTVFGIGIWVILARYVAIRVTHGLSWGRTLWVILLATLAIFLLKALLLSAGVLTAAAAVGAAFGGG